MAHGPRDYGPWAQCADWKGGSQTERMRSFDSVGVVAVAGESSDHAPAKAPTMRRRSPWRGRPSIKFSTFGDISLFTVRTLCFCCQISGFLGILSCKDCPFLLSFHVCVTADAI